MKPISIMYGTAALVCGLVAFSTAATAHTTQCGTTQGAFVWDSESSSTAALECLELSHVVDQYVTADLDELIRTKKNLYELDLVQVHVRNAIRANDAIQWAESVGLDHDTDQLAALWQVGFQYGAEIDAWILAKIDIKERYMNPLVQNSVEYHEGRAWFSDLKAWAFDSHNYLGRAQQVGRVVETMKRAVPAEEWSYN